jgi:hypothetical protein
MLRTTKFPPQKNEIEAADQQSGPEQFDNHVENISGTSQEPSFGRFPFNPASTDAAAN